MPKIRRRWHVLALKLSQKRRQLVKDMGGVCVGCGTNENLEFHHPDGGKKNWTASAMSRTERLARYRKDFEENNLELRCSDCHLAAHASPTYYDSF